MNLKKCKKVIAIIILVAIVSSITFFIGKQIGLNTDTSSTTTKIEEKEVEKGTITKTISSSGEITSTLTEKLELSTSKYFDVMCVEEDDIVKKGENILKYTNGTYLTASYDCVISEINIPSSGEKCTNEHYVKIESLNSLSITLNIDETKISQYNIGDEVEITISATSEEVTGNITSISNTASNGKFTVKVEFENTGNIKIGMSAII